MKNRIIGYYLATGNASAAARNENVPPRTAQNLIQRFKQTGSTANKPRPGRPRKLNDYDKRQVIRTARKNRRMPLAELTNQIATKVSVGSIRRVLAAQGYHRRVARKVPFLTPHHKHLRLVWAKMNKTLKSRDWDRVIFTDECYVWVSDKCGRIFVTRRKDERLLEECLVPAFKQSSVHVMFWGCIAEGRKGPLVVMEYPGGKGGGMNSKRYQEQVLEGPFWDFYTCLKRERRSIQFQQDGAPCHRSKSTIKWLDDHKVPLFFHHPIPQI
jgi:transposase